MSHSVSFRFLSCNQWPKSTPQCFVEANHVRVKFFEKRQKKNKICAPLQIRSPLRGVWRAHQQRRQEDNKHWGNQIRSAPISQVQSIDIYGSSVLSSMGTEKFWSSSTSFSTVLLRFPPLRVVVNLHVCMTFSRQSALHIHLVPHQRTDMVYHRPDMNGWREAKN